jgi:hypothetical protein
VRIAPVQRIKNLPRFGKILQHRQGTLILPFAPARHGSRGHKTEVSGIFDRRNCKSLPSRCLCGIGLPSENIFVVLIYRFNHNYVRVEPRTQSLFHDVISNSIRPDSGATALAMKNKFIATAKFLLHPRLLFQRARLGQFRSKISKPCDLDST